MRVLLQSATALISGMKRALLKLTGSYSQRPEPVRLPAHYVPEPSASVQYVWVPEFDLSDRQEQGYTYYLHPATGATCYRRVQRGNHVSHEFLMAVPRTRIAA